MVKTIFFILSLTTLLSATSLQDKISNFMGKSEYNRQKNLINIIFKNKSNYLNSKGKVDSLKVVKTLKQNGLLKLLFKKAQTLNLNFYTEDKNPLIFMRVINSSLEALGYSYYLSQNVAHKDVNFKWSINLTTQHIVDPILLSKELSKRGCKIVNIEKESKTKWHYALSSTNANIVAKNVDLDSTIALGKPIKPYLVDTKDAASISLRAHPADHWFPKIALFDENLDMIKEIRLKENRVKLKINLPEETKYIKISDSFTLENIKRGLSIYLKSNL